MVLNIFGATVAFTNGTHTGLNLRVLLDSPDSRMHSYASFFRLLVEQVGFQALIEVQVVSHQSG